ncbi:MAG: hypothetical protein Q8R00_01195 [Candidatus Nanoarchaeia archaeon]|nr:hypothetical protein [Candidatus Nanoarchaeia archaeon]
MKKTIFRLHEVYIKEFDRKQNHLVFGIKFSKNENLDELVLPWKIGDSVNLVNEIILKVKSKDKLIIETESDDILDNIYITRIDNEEAIEERMLDFFRRLFERIKSIKHESRPNVFMNLVTDVKHQKLVL